VNPESEQLTFAEASRGHLDQILDARRRYDQLWAERVRDEFRPQPRPKPVATPATPTPDAPLITQTEQMLVRLDADLRRAQAAFRSQSTDLTALTTELIGDAITSHWETRHIIGIIANRLGAHETLKYSYGEARNLHERNIHQITAREAKLDIEPASTAELIAQDEIAAEDDKLAEADSKLYMVIDRVENALPILTAEMSRLIHAAGRACRLNRADAIVMALDRARKTYSEALRIRDTSDADEAPIMELVRKHCPDAKLPTVKWTVSSDPFAPPTIVED